MFDTSWSRGRPFTTQIGVGMVIQGWDQGIVGMREGGRRLLKVPMIWRTARPEQVHLLAPTILGLRGRFTSHPGLTITHWAQPSLTE